MINHHLITIYKNPFNPQGAELHRKYKNLNELESDRPRIIKFFIRTKLIQAAHREVDNGFPRIAEHAHILSLIHNLVFCDTEAEIAALVLKYKGYIISHEYEEIYYFLELNNQPIN